MWQEMLVPVRPKWILTVSALGCAVAVATLLEGLETGTGQILARPYLLAAAILSGGVAAWQLILAQHMARREREQKRIVTADEPTQSADAKSSITVTAPIQHRAALGAAVVALVVALASVAVQLAESRRDTTTTAPSQSADTDSIDHSLGPTNPTTSPASSTSPSSEGSRPPPVPTIGAPTGGGETGSTGPTAPDFAVTVSPSLIANAGKWVAVTIRIEGATPGDYVRAAVFYPDTSPYRGGWCPNFGPPRRCTELAIGDAGGDQADSAGELSLTFDWSPLEVYGTSGCEPDGAPSDADGAWPVVVMDDGSGQVIETSFEVVSDENTPPPGQWEGYWPCD